MQFQRLIGILILIFLLTATLARAQSRTLPQDRPVKLDLSGRPLYNPWERQDLQRAEPQGREPARAPMTNQAVPSQRRTLPPPVAPSGSNATAPSRASMPPAKAAGSSAIHLGTSGAPVLLTTAPSNKPRRELPDNP